MNGDTTKTDMRSEIIYLVAAATDGRLPNLIESEPLVDIIIMIYLVAYCCSYGGVAPAKHFPRSSGVRIFRSGNLNLNLNLCHRLLKVKVADGRSVSGSD